MHRRSLDSMTIIRMKWSITCVLQGPRGFWGWRQLIPASKTSKKAGDTSLPHFPNCSVIYVKWGVNNQHSPTHVLRCFSPFSRLVEETFTADEVSDMLEGLEAAGAWTRWPPAGHIPASASHCLVSYWMIPARPHAPSATDLHRNSPCHIYS